MILSKEKIFQLKILIEHNRWASQREREGEKFKRFAGLKVSHHHHLSLLQLLSI